MQFGINVLNWGPGGSPEGLVGWAQTAEALGYHSVWISDHIAITTKVRERYPEPFFDPFMLLSWLAARTQRVALGTSICVVPYRHPILLARQIANLDHLSGGRFIFGVGVGSSDDEYQALGIPFGERGAIANESLGVIRALWTATEPVTFEGRYSTFEDVSPIRPFQSPHPPIWVGGRSEAAMRRAVIHGQAWHASRFTIPWITAVGLPTLRRIAGELDRPVPPFVPRTRLDIRDESVDGTDRLSGIGSQAQVRDDLAALEQLGAQHVVFDWNTGDPERTRGQERGFRMFAELAERVIDLDGETTR